LPIESSLGEIVPTISRDGVNRPYLVRELLLRRSTAGQAFASISRDGSDKQSLTFVLAPYRAGIYKQSSAAGRAIAKTIGRYAGYGLVGAAGGSAVSQLIQ